MLTKCDSPGNDDANVSSDLNLSITFFFKIHTASCKQIQTFNGIGKVIAFLHNLVTVLSIHICAWCVHVCVSVCRSGTLSGREQTRYRLFHQHSMRSTDKTSYNTFALYLF